MNKTFKEQIKEFWEENRRVIKAGFAFGVLGFMYGFSNGMMAEERLWLEHGFERAAAEPEDLNNEDLSWIDGDLL